MTIAIVVGTDKLPGFDQPDVLFDPCHHIHSVDGGEGLWIRTDPALVAWVRAHPTGSVHVVDWPDNVPWVYDDDLEYRARVRPDWRALVDPGLAAEIRCALFDVTDHRPGICQRC
jgi:hypothetical protein